MQPKEIDPNRAVGRVLDQLVKDYRRRQETIRRSRDHLMRQAGDNDLLAGLIQAEAMGTVDGLEWAIDRINEIRLDGLRRVQRASGSTLAEHTDTVDLP